MVRCTGLRGISSESIGYVFGSVSIVYDDRRLYYTRPD